MITHEALLGAIDRAFEVHPVVALLGLHQVGKTLAAQFCARLDGKALVFDLESPADLRRLSLPETVLSEPAALIIIDEIQRLPGLFEILRVIVDRTARRQRFLILGSASPDLMKGVAESLAGREAMRTLWLRGGFPSPPVRVSSPAHKRTGNPNKTWSIWNTPAARPRPTLHHGQHL